MDLDTSQLPTRIVTTLMLRGSQAPPLQWAPYPNRTAKNVLDEAGTNTELFGIEPLLDDKMATAVRTLLYLWNGWFEDAGECAAGAPDQERAYIEGVIERQTGNAPESKAKFQMIETHPVYQGLAEYVPAAVGGAKATALKRLREVIAFVEEWEPYVFADVYELALEGRLDEDGELAVRKIQNREFELLFKHCFEAATGQTLKKRPDDAARVRPRKPKRPNKTYNPPQPSHTHSPNQEKSAKIPLKPQITGVVVACPHCQEQNRTTEEQRGKVISCLKCRAPFKVPRRAAANKVPLKPPRK